MRGGYTLRDGREIVLRELRQYLTHEGVLEGRPSRDDNGHQLTALVRRHQQDGRGVFLHAGDIELGATSEAFPFGRPATLPAVTCLARFVSFTPTKNSDLMCSELTLIWFQNVFWREPPFDAAIAGIDWDALAFDYDI